MRLSANENFPGVAVERLRAAGHDVFWVRTHLGGASDVQVLAHAVAEGRLLLTFDKDFGELAFRSNLPATCGVVLFRLSVRSPDEMAARVVEALAIRGDWTGNFAVVSDDRIRMRTLPGAAGG
jgi:predicted nuclease of predicted toxin-antitoxin system